MTDSRKKELERQRSEFSLEIKHAEENIRKYQRRKDDCLVEIGRIDNEYDNH